MIEHGIKKRQTVLLLYNYLYEWTGAIFSPKTVLRLYGFTTFEKVNGQALTAKYSIYQFPT